jgi:[CysO sulfur-carrier protein]-S-L-cysteine hydrolase
VDPTEIEPLLPAILAEVSLRYPAEACGLLLEGRAGALLFAAIPNIAGTSAASGTSTRTGADGYVMDPARVMAALSAAEAEGGGLRAIVHSHPDVGAYFSKEDRDMALAGGRSPLWPGVDYLVISCRRGVCDDARLYRWDESRADFLELQLPGIKA